MQSRTRVVPTLGPDFYQSVILAQVHEDLYPAPICTMYNVQCIYEAIFYVKNFMTFLARMTLGLCRHPVDILLQSDEAST